MPSHKFKVGEMVELQPAANRNAGGVYEMLKLLPGNGECDVQLAEKRGRSGVAASRAW
jgi:hypothetical protein